MHKYYRSSHVFTEPEVQKIKTIFNETSPDCFKSKQSMDYSLCTLTGKKDPGFCGFKKTIGQQDCVPQDDLYVQAFSQELSRSLDSLNLITAESQVQYSTAIKKAIHNVCLERINTEAVVPPVWDITHRDLCISKMQSLSYWDLPNLKKISFFLDTFPTETITMVYPYVGALLTFPVFYTCFSVLSDGGFFKTLFKGTIDHLESRAFSLRDLWLCPHNRKIVVCGLVLTSGFAGFKFLSPAKVALAAVQEAKETIPVPIPIDHLARFRCTGFAGYVLQEFEENSGALLHSGLRVAITWAKIVLHSFTEEGNESAARIFAKLLFKFRC